MSKERRDSFMSGDLAAAAAAPDATKAMALGNQWRRLLVKHLDDALVDLCRQYGFESKHTYDLDDDNDATAAESDTRRLLASAAAAAGPIGKGGPAADVKTGVPPSAQETKATAGEVGELVRLVMGQWTTSIPLRVNLSSPLMPKVWVHFVLDVHGFADKDPSSCMLAVSVANSLDAPDMANVVFSSKVTSDTIALDAVRVAGLALRNKQVTMDNVSALLSRFLRPTRS